MRMQGGRKVIKPWSQMRVKRNALRKIHSLAVREKRSDQSMLNVLVAEALRARGMAEE